MRHGVRGVQGVEVITKSMRENHIGDVETSGRLKEGLAYMRRYGRLGPTGLKIAKDLNCTSPRDLMRHLKRNGLPISKAIYAGRSENGRPMFRWFWEG